MPTPAFKSGAVHIVFIVLFLMVSTILATLVISAREGGESRTLDWRKIACRADSSRSYCAELAASPSAALSAASPSPSTQQVSAQAPKNDANATCEILYPAPSAGKVVKVKPSGYFTVKVTGVPTYEKSHSYTWGTIGPLNMYHIDSAGPTYVANQDAPGIITYEASGRGGAGPDGIFIVTGSVSGVSGKAKEEAFKQRKESQYVLFLKRYSLGGAKKSVANCGFLVVSPNAPEPTIPRPSTSPKPIPGCPQRNNPVCDL